MKKLYLVDARCCWLALMLGGCDFSGNDLPHLAKEPNSNNATTTVPETPAESIDLTLPPAMLEAQQQEKDFLAPAEIPPTSFTSSPEENDVSFSGKLHLDESEDKEYLDAVDGAEVKIKVKFE